jgi:hypothetical protein
MCVNATLFKGTASKMVGGTPTRNNATTTNEGTSLKDKLAFEMGKGTSTNTKAPTTSQGNESKDKARGKGTPTKSKVPISNQGMTSSKDKMVKGDETFQSKALHTTNQLPLSKENAPEVSLDTPTQGKVQLKNSMTSSKAIEAGKGTPSRNKALEVTYKVTRSREKALEASCQTIRPCATNTNEGTPITMDMSKI